MNRIATFVLVALIIATPASLLADGYYMIDSSRRNGPAMATAQSQNIRYDLKKYWCGCPFNAEFGYPYPTEEPLIGHLFEVYGWVDEPTMLASDAAMIPVTHVLAGLPTSFTTAPVRFINSLSEMNETSGTKNLREICLIKRQDMCVKHAPVAEQIRDAILNKKFGKIRYGSFAALVAEYRKVAKGFDKKSFSLMELACAARRVADAARQDATFSIQAEKIRKDFERLHENWESRLIERLLDKDFLFCQKFLRASKVTEDSWLKTQESYMRTCDELRHTSDKVVKTLKVRMGRMYSIHQKCLEKNWGKTK